MTSLGVENPVIITLNPEAVGIIPTFMIRGDERLIVADWLGAGEGVMSAPPDCSLTLSESVPATVPVCKYNSGTENKASVAVAAMLKGTLRPPVENWTVASSP